MISELIRSFSRTYKSDVGKTISKELDSYQTIVEKIPTELQSIIDHNHLDIKGSIGQGNTTYYPWIGIFDERVSTGARNGFYIVFLFSDDYDHVYLTLNQGSTRQTEEEIQGYRNFVFEHVSEINGFQSGQLPEGSLVRERQDSTPNKGSAYEKTNLFYKHYLIDNLTDEELVQDIRSLLSVYQKLANTYEQRNNDSNNAGTTLSVSKFNQDVKQANLLIDENLGYRFVAALISKPFLILTGLSGSGKTKIAQAFCYWLESSSQENAEKGKHFTLVPVGSDWTNSEPILGYPNALSPGKYVKPDSGVLDLLIKAKKPENQQDPFFLILDEMNLSHVERYFADFLSAMESGEPIPIHPAGDQWDQNIPAEISLPDNLFIIGTVNIDETTYMFSPKVLDRAQVIEFHVTSEEIQQFLENPQKPDLGNLLGKGAEAAADFLRLARKSWDSSSIEKEAIQKALEKFFLELRKTGAEFGYRTAYEITRFCSVLSHLTQEDEKSWEIDKIIDAAVMQKLLPRLHGSRKKLEPVLNNIAELCFQEDTDDPQQSLQDLSDYPEKISSVNEVRYPISLEKILRMKKRVEQEGFTSFAEA